MAVRLYIDDVNGVAHHVYDVRFAEGKTKRVPLGDSSANYRVFVSATDARRLHKFGRGDDHGIRETDLERQLRSAGFAATSTFDASALTPDPRPPYTR